MRASATVYPPTLAALLPLLLLLFLALLAVPSWPGSYFANNDTPTAPCVPDSRLALCLLLPEPVSTHMHTIRSKHLHTDVTKGPEAGTPDSPAPVGLAFLTRKVQHAADTFPPAADGLWFVDAVV